MSAIFSWSKGIITLPTDGKKSPFQFALPMKATRDLIIISEISGMAFLQILV